MSSNFHRAHSIKIAQREKTLFKELSYLLLQLALDHPELNELVPTRVKISADKGTCFLLLYTKKGLAYFQEHFLDILKVYRPSMRKIIAHNIRSRYTPEIKFEFDETFEKQERLESLMQKIASD